MVRCRSLHIAVLLSCSVVHSFFLHSDRSAGSDPRPFQARQRQRLLWSSFGSQNGDSQDVDALRSLADFHEGTWHGQIRSFAVTSDVAAGIVQRKTSPSYTTRVRFQVDVEKRDFSLSEDYDWSHSDNDGNNKDDVDRNNEREACTRQVSLTRSRMDVDDVDGSYSFDATLPNFPAKLIGTDKQQRFLIEHCIATSETTRSRCWAFYGIDQNLIRVVVAEESRQQTAPPMQQSEAGNGAAALTAKDLIDMQGDVDRLVEKLTGNNNNGTQLEGETTRPLSSLGDLQDAVSATSMSSQSVGGNQPHTLEPHPVSLLELSSGIWLGDSVIRDLPQIPLSLQRGQGFGRDTKASIDTVPFASWSVGVQKIAWRWMWNFGEEIRQVNDFGKAMGSAIADALTSDLAGSVCVNEGLSRRIPKEERMVYIDWTGDNVGFLVGSHSMQVPRFLNFDQTRQLRPFYTEFCCFQREKEADPSPDNIPVAVCSKISRVYNYQGLLKQGCTSFFTLKRFGTDTE